jgi:putative nucleotidyltransferase with HDIG domain
MAATGRRLPALAIELVDLMKDPSTSVAKLVALITAEPVLRERVLRMANSSALGMRSRVSNLSYAIALLGFDALRDTLVRLLVNGSFRNLVDVLLHYEQYWNHSISCAVAARGVARKTESVNPEDAFTAGLFHDIGTVMLAVDRSRTAGVDTPCQASDRHSDVGAWLAAEWGLGPRIVDAIRHHHDPENAVLDQALASVVHVADIVCRRLDIGRFAFDPEAKVSPAALGVLRLREDDLSPEALQEEAGRIRDGVQDAPAFEELVVNIKGALMEGFGRLTTDERLTLALCHQEGLSFEEVGKLLGNTAADVRRMHRQALESLARVVNECL